MKKMLSITAATCLVALSAPVSADVLFSLEAEAQYWQADAGGYHTYAQTLDSGDIYDWKKSGQLGFGVTLTHFIPLIPNFKFETQELKFTGDYNTFETISIDLSHETYTLFYAPFDNDVVAIHFGASLKQFDGYVAPNLGMTHQPFWEIDEDVVSAYLKLAAGLPFSGLSVVAEGHFGSFGDNDLHDIQGAVRYRFLDSLAFDGYLSVGYRSIKIDFDDTTTFMTRYQYDFTGPFASLSIRF
ncbi:hypothetical protein A28LD_1323 [Idiomarina sp. A28L]|uniref:TIGR04219 family outer membrane beta-barrel protein n=1 Tax=Idiomarina sp. A28L TaxID=1036674 RepID=UPI000213878D|nr:TIGR04219 family outer membrane beta-barrel protein [Idiomarina sp. A28L]EGN75306.1 hypothetical protein A28LD_1323 [Idiomarina sp. A28L]